MALGSAFQKVNFLRDLKADHDELNRTYFPNTDLNNLDEIAKQHIIDDIENDFAEGLNGIKTFTNRSKVWCVYGLSLLQSITEKTKENTCLRNQKYTNSRP